MGVWRRYQKIESSNMFMECRINQGQMAVLPTTTDSIQFSLRFQHFSLKNFKEY